MKAIKICNQCGKEHECYPNARYCPECRVIRQKERAQRMRLYGAMRPLGTKDNCTRCGAEYIVESGLQKYCPKCRQEAYLEMDRIGGMKYYGANSDEINPKRNIRRIETRAEKQPIINTHRRKPPKKSCEWCGNIFAHHGTRSKTCSVECKRMYYNKRKREARKENNNAF